MISSMSKFGLTAVTAALAAVALAQDGTASLPATVAAVASRAPEAMATPIKVMFVGDSITHGHEGDYTWRYRMWEWFRANNISFDFVGPYTGTIAPQESKPPQPPRPIQDPAPETSVDTYPRIAWGYAKDINPDFDADHFATSGDRADRVNGLIEGRVEEYEPDILLILLGTNDLAWGGALPNELFRNIKLLVENARKAKPNIKIALGNVLGRTYVRPNLANYIFVANKLMQDACPSWSTAESPIHYVDVASAYSCGLQHCAAAFDGLHPNGLGAFQIAYAFSKALIEHFSLGQVPIQVPEVVPERELPAPLNLHAESSPMGIKVTWDRHFGLTEYKVRQRIQGAPTWNTSTALTNRIDTALSSAGIRCEYQVKSCFGHRCGSWTGEIATAVSDRDTPPPPMKIRTTPTELGFIVSWSPPQTHWNITQYEIKFINRKTTLGLSVGSKELSAKLEGMSSGQYSIVGEVIMILVSSWAGEGYRGLYADGRPVLPGGSTPQAPKGLLTRHLNSTAVWIKWTSSVDAAAYLIRAHDLNFPNQSKGILEYGTEHTLVIPEGSGSHSEICVTAVNGELQSEETCMRHPQLNLPFQDYTRTFSYLSAAYFLLLVIVSYTLSRDFIWNHYRDLGIRL